MEPANKVMHGGEAAILGGEVPRRDPHGVGGGEQSVEEDEEACVFPRRHHPLSVPKRRTPRSLQWGHAHRLQPLVSPWSP